MSSIQPQDNFYAQKYWEKYKDDPKLMQEMREVKISHIKKSAKEGIIHLFISPAGIDEKDKEKLAVLRVLAKEMGYRIGKFTGNPKTHTASAHIEKLSQTSILLKSVAQKCSQEYTGKYPQPLFLVNVFFTEDELAVIDKLIEKSIYVLGEWMKVNPNDKTLEIWDKIVTSAQDTRRRYASGNAKATSARHFGEEIAKLVFLVRDSPFTQS